MLQILLTSHKYASNHKDDINRSNVCGCFFCGRQFSSGEITEWIDGGNTALCPFCGIDAVLGDGSGLDISTEFLIDMYRKWFIKDWFMV